MGHNSQTGTRKETLSYRFPLNGKAEGTAIWKRNSVSMCQMIGLCVNMWKQTTNIMTELAPDNDWEVSYSFTKWFGIFTHCHSKFTCNIYTHSNDQQIHSDIQQIHSDDQHTPLIWSTYQLMWSTYSLIWSTYSLKWSTYSLTQSTYSPTGSTYSLI